MSVMTATVTESAVESPNGVHGYREGGVGQVGILFSFSMMPRERV